MTAISRRRQLRGAAHRGRLFLLLFLLFLPRTTTAQTIAVNRDCVVPGESFAVTFQNLAPFQADDWIGIVPASEPVAAFISLGTWVWTCGTDTCTTAAASGRVTLVSNTIAEGAWVAVLSRGDTAAPWAAYAVSQVFTVAASCASSPPVAAATVPPSNVRALQHLEEAWGEIESIIDEDFRMAPQFLRMAFHDCIGGCDGCIDLDHHDNAGIEPAIDALSPIVARHAVDGVSRADLWALSAVVATDITQRDDSRIDFSINWWGRVDCENTGQPCVGEDGSPVLCTAKKGSFRSMPGLHMHTHELYGFFANNFGFDQRETVTIMGAHTLGVIREEDFGIDAPNGWVLDVDTMDNQYYEELVGGTSPDDPVEVLVNDAPGWRRIIEGGIRFWVGFPQGIKIVMLNTDIALLRQLDESNMDKSIGRVSCTFEDNTATETVPVCPHVEGALQIAAEFFHDNLLWLQEFRDVLDRMITNGYSRPDCGDVICQVGLL